MSTNAPSGRPHDCIRDRQADAVEFTEVLEGIAIGHKVEANPTEVPERPPIYNTRMNTNSGSSDNEFGVPLRKRTAFSIPAELPES